MHAEDQDPLDPQEVVALDLLDSLLGGGPYRDFAIRLWKNRIWRPANPTQPRFTLVLRSEGALRKVLTGATMLSLGEAFVSDDVDIEGDLEAAFQLGDYLLTAKVSVFRRLALLLRLHRFRSIAPRPTGRPPARLRGRRGSRTRTRLAIAYHYDLPTEFWKLWLDPRMLYSCAYFADPSDSLESAQRRKLDYVCRKLFLEPGERLLDLGCGWGALMVHAAKYYGCQVLGVTLSGTQADYVHRLIRDEGLTSQCSVVHCDYRDLGAMEPFDKVASIGSIEHVLEADLPLYYSTVWKLLKPGGLLLSHGITHRPRQYLSKGPSFVDRFVFPDHDVIPYGRVLPPAEVAGFEVRDTECLREHYVLTCRYWLRRFESRKGEVESCTDPGTFRVFRLYLAAMAHYFATGQNSIHQTLLLKPAGTPTNMPLTRAGWYRSEAEATPSDDLSYLWQVDRRGGRERLDVESK